MLQFAFDIGGSAIKVGIFDENHQIIKKDKIIHEPGQVEYESVLEKIDSYIEKEDLSKFSTICISAPGAIAIDTGEIKGLNAIANSLGKNYVEYFKNKYKLRVFCENDSNCATLAEMKLGNAIKANNALVVVVGSGVGGSLIINKQLYRGSNYFAGELGFVYENELPDDFIKKYPRVKCKIGSFYGMYFLCAKYGSITKTHKNGKEIFSLYQNDKVAKECIDEMVFGLAKIIANAAAIIDPELILIGGAVSENNFFIDSLRKKINFIYNDKMMCTSKLKIKRCKFGNDANLIGATFIANSIK